MIAAYIEALGPAWIWIVAGLVLAGAEIALPGVFLIWLGLAALLTGMTEMLLPMPWQAQLLLWGGLALACALAAARLDRRRPAGSLNRPDRGLIGREAVLSEPISGGDGRLRFDDTLWRITGPDLPAGTRVRVTERVGTVLTVTAA